VPAQFGNNWIQKIPLTAKLDLAAAVFGIFFIQLFPNWTACSPITYKSRADNKPFLIVFYFHILKEIFKESFNDV
jgi:hypothetical protein